MNSKSRERMFDYISVKDTATVEVRRISDTTN